MFPGAGSYWTRTGIRHFRGRGLDRVRVRVRVMMKDATPLHGGRSTPGDEQRGPHDRRRRRRRRGSSRVRG